MTAAEAVWMTKVGALDPAGIETALNGQTNPAGTTASSDPASTSATPCRRSSPRRVNGVQHEPGPSSSSAAHRTRDEPRRPRRDVPAQVLTREQGALLRDKTPAGEGRLRAIAAEEARAGPDLP